MDKCIKFVLTNNGNSLEFAKKSEMLSYYKRFIKLFPSVDLSSVSMFKVVVYDLNSLKNE